MPQARATIQDGGRRLWALRIFLGYAKREQWAKRLAPAGFSLATLRNIETGRRGRPLYEDEAHAISEEVGVPYSYWTAPAGRLGDIGEPGPPLRHRVD